MSSVSASDRNVTMTVTTFHQLFSPIFYFSRLLGLFPFYENWTISNPLALISLIVVSLNVAISPFLCIFQFLCRRSKLYSCIRVFNGFEENLAKMKLPCVYSLNDFYIAFLLRSLSVILISLYYVFGKWNKGFLYPLHDFCFFINIFLINCIGMQFFALLCIVKCQMTSLNRALSVLRQKDLEVLIKLHCWVCKAAEDVNSVYSWSLLSKLTFFYIHLLQHAWNTFKYSHNILNKQVLDVFELSMSLCWLSYTLGHLLLVPSFCVVTANEGAKTNRILYRLMLSERRLLSRKKLILQLEMNRRVEFTACGLFPIDFAMIHSVVASVGIFLAVLAQVISADVPVE